MKDYKGYRLYVNLGPSKVRRILKGYGLGVKKVQSAGRNQAVIIHTATGEHLRELEGLFAGAVISESESELSQERLQVDAYEEAAEPPGGES